MSSERQLVEGLRGGDARAFDEAYQSYRAGLYSFLVRMTGRRELAEDFLQDTFLRLARHSRRLRPDTNLRAWLFTVARNLCRSHYRWAAANSQGLSVLADGDLGAARTPFEELAGNRLEQAVERALDELAPPLREAILLVAVERLSPADAADVLGVRNATLRQRLRRARVAVAKALGKGHDVQEQP